MSEFITRHFHVRIGVAVPVFDFSVRRNYLFPHGPEQTLRLSNFRLPPVQFSEWRAWRSQEKFD